MNIHNRFYELTQSSPLLEHLQERNHDSVQNKEYNIEDLDTDVQHIICATPEKRESYYAYLLNIVVDGFFEGLTPYYRLDKNGIPCLNLHDETNTAIDKVFIHDPYMIAELEYIFNIKFCKEAKELSNVDKESRSARMMEVLRKECHLPPHSSIRFDILNNGDLDLTASTLDCYKAGANHIKHIVDYTGDYIWLDPKEKVEAGKRYKQLFMADYDCFELCLFTFDGMMKQKSDYNFFMEVLDNTFLGEFDMLKNELLLNKLIPLCRKTRIKNLIRFL